jgi:hypothetical protein
MDELVREAEKEAALAKKVEQATRLTYEQKSEQLKNGWDMEASTKGTRYGMRAAGLWTMRRQLRKLVKTANSVRKNGEKGDELEMVREFQFATRMEGVSEKMQQIREFQALPWSTPNDAKRRLEKCHKQRPAKDSELVKFYEAATRSSFRTAFLVAEFSGCRGAEFGDHGPGIRIEAAKKDGVAMLRFFIQSAKADGKEKGLDMRCIESAFPFSASEEVQRRWLELAKKVAAQKSLVVKIDPGKPKKPKEGEKPKPPATPGQRFTNACKMVSRSAEVEVAAYSFRHRFSAQVKASNPGDAVAVALALGHQTTETQRHYSRASRGGGGVSPVQVTGVAVPGAQAVRGARVRSGPSQAFKDKLAMEKSTPQAAAPPSYKARGKRL